MYHIYNSHCCNTRERKNCDYIYIHAQTQFLLGRRRVINEFAWLSVQVWADVYECGVSVNGFALYSVCTNHCNYVLYIFSSETIFFCATHVISSCSPVHPHSWQVTHILNCCYFSCPALDWCKACCLPSAGATPPLHPCRSHFTHFHVTCLSLSSGGSHPFVIPLVDTVPSGWIRETHATTCSLNIYVLIYYEACNTVVFKSYYQELKC